MKSALKLSLAALTATAIAVPAHADMINNLAVKAGATYTETSGNGLNFATVSNGKEMRQEFIKPSHSFDYALGLTYPLFDSRHRLFVNYERFKDGESRTLSGDVGFTNSLGRGVGPGETVTATIAHKERDFKLGSMETLHFGQIFELDLIGGFEYLKIERSLTTRLSTGESKVFYNESKGWGSFASAIVRVYPRDNHNRS